MENKEDYALYKKISVTDPKHTKNVKVGQRTFTNIDTYYLIEKATEQFGFYGKGFGLKDIKREIMDIGDTKLVIMDAVFYFPDGDFPISSSDKLAYMTKGNASNPGYLVIDTDIFKKLETNILAKALSKIGFGADVYKGQFEDQNYLNEAFEQKQLCSVEQMQVLRKGLGFYKVDARLVNEQFIISTLSELPASEYERAQAFIKQIGENQTKKESEAK